MWHIGIDLHRKTVVFAAIRDSGEVRPSVKLDCSQTAEIVRAFEQLRPFRAVIEATRAYRWLFKLLSPLGTVLLAHPLRLRAMVQRRSKTDRLDAQLLAQLLRIDQIPLAYIPTDEQQMLRDVTRQRARLTQSETQTKIFLRWILARHNMQPPYACPFGPRGLYWFSRQDFGPVDNSIRDELLTRLMHYQKEIAAVDDRLRSLRSQYPQVESLLVLHGIGLYTAMVIVGEFGEGFRQHAADLMEIAKGGSEVARYQSKLHLTLRSAAKYLADPRYEGMKLLTTRQSHATVMEQLAKREANAARRGVKLAPGWQRVRDAIDSTRLPARFAGKALPTERGMEALARKAAQEQFDHASRTLQPQTGSLRLARFGGHLLVAADLAMSGYLQYKDMRRYAQGDLSEDMLLAKTGVRGIQCSLALYAATSPEPFTKVTAVVVVVVLAADAGLEIIQRRRELAAREILERIDREEQFHAVRAYLLKEFRG